MITCNDSNDCGPMMNCESNICTSSSSTVEGGSIGLFVATGASCVKSDDCNNAWDICEKQICVHKANYFWRQLDDPFTLTGVWLCIKFTLLVLSRYRRSKLLYPNGYTFEYDTTLAFLRAFIFFHICYLLGFACGTMEFMAKQNPISRYFQDDTINGKWIYFCIGCFFAEFIFYWVIWGLITVQFDRKRAVLTAFLFSTFWGGAFGNLIVALVKITDSMTGWLDKDAPSWGPAAVYFIVWNIGGAGQGLIMDYFFDIYVSPEHDTPWSLKVKVVTTHIPNLSITLIFLIMYPQSAIIFCFFHCFALFGACYHMRFPSMFDLNEKHIHSACIPGAFGFLHGKGYVKEDNTWNMKDPIYNYQKYSCFQKKKGSGGSVHDISSDGYQNLNS